MRVRKYTPRHATVNTEAECTVQTDVGALHVVLSLPLLPGEKSAQSEQDFPPFNFDDFPRDGEMNLIKPEGVYLTRCLRWVENFRAGAVNLEDTSALLNVMFAAKAIGVDPFSGSKIKHQMSGQAQTVSS